MKKYFILLFIIFLFVYGYPQKDSNGLDIKGTGVILTEHDAEIQTEQAKYFRVILSAEISPLLQYIYDDHSTVTYNNKANWLLGIDASYFFIKRKFNLGFSTGVIFKTKNYYAEYWHTYPTIESIMVTNKYIYLSVPITLKSKIVINKYFFTFVEIGIFLNNIISTEYLAQYPDGSTKDSYPSDLQFEKLNELYFSLSIGRLISKSRMSVELKPYVLYKFKEEDYYKRGYYNLGRTGIGLSLVFNLFMF